MTTAKQLTNEELSDLAEKSNDFGKKLLGGWSDSTEFDAKAFQLRYLHVNASRALSSAHSFWLLYKEGKNHDSQIIARTLLERIVYARVAAKSPERACSILATNRYKDRDGVRKLINFDKANFDTQEIREMQDIASKEIDQLLALAGRTTVQEWNFAEMCQEVELEWVYRMIYRDFSEYTHASYGVARPLEGDQLSVPAIYMALLAPMDTATQYSVCAEGRLTPELLQAYKALYYKISDPLLGQKPPPTS